ncbi:MAG: YdcF family protein [Gammaproteobacteria bacterium]
MSTALLYTACKLLVLPPGLMVASGLLGLACRPFARRLGNALVVFALVATYVLSTPWMAAMLATPLERHVPLEPVDDALRGLEAIVVLGGGTYRDAPEYGFGDEVSRLTLERLRYAAHLHRRSGLGVAVVGGNPSDIDDTEAAHMKSALERDFRVPVRWTETVSRNTAENASASAATFPFRRIALVTHAMHMPRAARAFSAAGFAVTPAPMGFVSAAGGGEPGVTYTDLLPDIHALAGAHYAIYEYLGAAWYALTRE